MILRLIPRTNAAFLLLLTSTIAIAFEISGATGGIDATTGARPSRYEISQFSQSGPAWSLFILALYEIQRTNQWDPLSYFSIAGTGCHASARRPLLMSVSRNPRLSYGAL